MSPAAKKNQLTAMNQRQNEEKMLSPRNCYSNAKRQCYVPGIKIPSCFLEKKRRTKHGWAKQHKARSKVGRSSAFLITQLSTSAFRPQLLSGTVYLKVRFRDSYRTRLSRPIRCDVWIVKRMRYRPTDQGTQQVIEVLCCT